jgi:hypothetical protein
MGINRVERGTFRGKEIGHALMDDGKVVPRDQSLADAFLAGHDDGEDFASAKESERFGDAGIQMEGLGREDVSLSGRGIDDPVAVKKDAAPFGSHESPEKGSV